MYGSQGFSRSNMIKKIIISAVLLIIFFISYHAYKNYKDQIETYKVAALEGQKYKPLYYNTKYADSVAQITMKGQNDLLLEENSTLQHTIDLLGVKSKEAESEIVTTTKTVVKKQLVHDTIPGAYIFKDGYALINLDSLHRIQVELQDTLYQVTTKETHKGQDFYTVRAKNTNPYVKITDMSAVRINVPKQKSRLAIGIQAGYGVAMTPDKKFIHPSPYFGVGISYNIFTFNKKEK